MSYLNFKYLVGGLLLFLFCLPYFIWHDINTYIPFLTFLTPLYFFLFNRKLTRKDSVLLILSVSALVLSSVTGGSNIIGTFSRILLIFYAFIAFPKMINFYKAFKLIYSTVLTLSIIVYFLIILGINLPYNIIEPLNSLKESNYYQYPFLVIPTGLSHDLLGRFRFMGVFDEPGVVGTLSALFLFIEKLNLKRKSNVIILISGILSFSLFFYLSIFIFMLLNFYTNKNRLVVYLILIVTIGIGININIVNDLIINRLKFDKNEKTIIGDNRSDQRLDDFFSQSIGKQEFYFGYGNKFMEKYSGSASYKNAILKFGLIPCSLQIIFLMLYGWFYRTTIYNFGIYCFILFATLYQRPGLFSEVYMFLFISFIIYNRFIHNDVFRLNPTINQIQNNVSLNNCSSYNL